MGTKVAIQMATPAVIEQGGANSVPVRIEYLLFSIYDLTAFFQP
jgi:hypothetical protein